MKKLSIILFCSILLSNSCSTKFWRITTNTGNGYIDKYGKIVIPPTFYQLDDQFNNGLAWFSDSIQSGYLDKKGRIVFANRNAHYEFHEGLTAFIQNDQLGFFNKKGKIVIPPQYNWSIGLGELPYFSGGMAVVPVRINDTDDNISYIFIDKKGRNVFNQRFLYANNFSNELASVTYISGENGYINKHGCLKIKIDKDFIGYEFSEGFALLVNYELSIAYYIDLKGRKLGNLTFEKAETFSNGMAKVKLNGKWGFINKKGELVIQPLYNENTYDFSNGVASVSINDPSDSKGWKNLTYIINKKGNILAGPFSDVVIKKFNGDLAAGYKELQDRPWGCDEYFYINRQGKIIWKDTVCIQTRVKEGNIDSTFFNKKIY